MVEGSDGKLSIRRVMAFLVTIAGGGAIVTPVFYDGVNWVAH